jgi:carbamoylphosphate synthase large subunit
MTDPGMADRTYIGPMTPEYAEQILAKVGQEQKRGFWVISGI